MPLPTEISKPEIDPSQLCVLIYTESGLGKSTFCSRVNGIIFLPNAQAGLKHIEGYKYPLIGNWEEYRQAYTELKNEKHSFRAVCLDTITEMHRMAADFMCRKYNVQHETDLPGDNNKGYTLVNNEFFRLIKAFYSLGLGVYMTAHCREEKVKTKTQEWTRIVPDLPGKSRNAVIALADFVLYGESEEYEDEKDENKRKIRRILHSKPNPLWMAKDRFSVVPDPIALSYPDFFKTFTEGMKKKAEPGPTQQKTESKPEAKTETKPEPAPKK
jgi:phage nucleotide-binding protein